MTHASEAQMAHEWDEYIAEADEAEDDEEWLPVAGFEGFYEVSESGRCRRIASASGTNAGKILRPVADDKGYFCYNLYADGRRLRVKAHRITAEAFIGPAGALPLCRHLDGDPANNHFSNLRWGTHQENSDDRILHGRSAGLRPARTHCKQGHEFTPENTRMRHERGKRPYRVCATCRRKWQGRAA